MIKSDEGTKRSYGESGFAAHWVQTFEMCLVQQQLACQNLESVADSLPVLLNVDEVLALSLSLVTALKDIHSFEEDDIFPKLISHAARWHAIIETVERLKSEHLEDEDYALNVCTALQEYLTKQDHRSSENLGWMLRGLFETIRRHVAFEREHILPLVNQIARADH